MMRSVSNDLDQFYLLLSRLAVSPGQGRLLREISSRSPLPRRGVYFFLEPGEYRTVNPTLQRVVRVGTHAVTTGSKATLYGRLKKHWGTRAGGGNHRGSVFRRHVGNALQARDGIPLLTWGGSSAPPAVRNSDAARATESECEKRVSEYIGRMPVLWIDVPDDVGPQSKRAFIERNAIALLSNQGAPIDKACSSWLGRWSPQKEIRESGLWNMDYVYDVYDPSFLEAFESFVMLTCQK